MPSMETYRKLHSGTTGQERKRQSDQIMDFTWWNDIQSKVAYLYDYYHDDYKKQLDDLDSPNDSKKIPIDIKFVQSSSQTYNKDAVTVHLQLRPEQKCNVWYYEKLFKQRYNATFPVALYVDIPDEQGIYNRWLVVQKANYNVTQFPTFEILRCDKVFQYVIDRKKYWIAGVLQSQNSYNSGIWTDFKMSTVEDQQKFIVPLNRDTEKIYYNQRMIIDSAVLTEPRTWKVSKINRITSNGLVLVTLAQTQFNPNTDYIEIGEDGNVIGMWADYYVENTTAEPTDAIQPQNNIIATITYTGNSTIRLNGGYKKLTVNFTEGDKPSDFMFGQWQYFVDDIDVSDLIIYSPTELAENEIKFKISSTDLTYGGKTLVVKYIVNDDIQTSLELGITNF